MQDMSLSPESCVKLGLVNSSTLVRVRARSVVLYFLTKTLSWRHVGVQQLVALLSVCVCVNVGALTDGSISGTMAYFVHTMCAVLLVASYRRSTPNSTVLRVC